MSEATNEKPFTLTMPVAIVFASFVIAGAILITKSPSTTAGAAAPAGAVTISIRPPSTQDHILGSPDAPVVIVEYSDFQCPFCSVIYPTLKNIVENSQGKIAWVYRNYPLDSIHPEARPAAEAAECIAAELGNDAFWKFVDADFTNQKTIGSAFYAKVAKDLGADPAQFKKCVDSKQYDDRITTDEAEGLKNGANGTPFTIVVGKKGSPVPFSGALPADQIQAIVSSVQAQQK